MSALGDALSNKREQARTTAATGIVRPLHTAVLAGRRPASGNATAATVDARDAAAPPCRRINRVGLLVASSFVVSSVRFSSYNPEPKGTTGMLYVARLAHAPFVASSFPCVHREGADIAAAMRSKSHHAHCAIVTAGYGSRWHLAARLLASQDRIASYQAA